MSPATKRTTSVMKIQFNDASSFIYRLLIALLRWFSFSDYIYSCYQIWIFCLAFRRNLCDLSKVRYSTFFQRFTSSPNECKVNIVLYHLASYPLYHSPLLSYYTTIDTTPLCSQSKIGQIFSLFSL